jgi:hypothetical protein
MRERADTNFGPQPPWPRPSWERESGRVPGGIQGHAWKTTGCDVVSIFLADDRRTLHALAKDERPAPPLPIDAKQATARDHARALSEMADTAARDSARCQSSGAALGSQACKECRALLESKMSIGTDVPPDQAYTGRSRN